MRMLCTIVQPSEGQILWNGKDIWKLGGEYLSLIHIWLDFVGKW